VPDADSHSLSALASHFDLTLKPNRMWHTAVGDAEITAQLLVSLFEIAAGWGIKTTTALGISGPQPWTDVPPPDPSIRLIERDPEVWPPRNLQWQPREQLSTSDEIDSGAEARREGLAGSPIVSLSVTIPDEFLAKVEALSRTPQAIAFRRQRDEALAAAGDAVIDLDTAWEITDGETEIPQGSEGIELLRKAIRTFEVAGYDDDAREATELLARQLGRRRRYLEAATSWADAVDLTVRAYQEDPELFGDELDVMVLEALPRAVKWRPHEAVRIIDTVARVCHQDPERIDNLVSAVAGLLTPEEIEAGSFAVEAMRRAATEYAISRDHVDRLIAVRAHRLERLGHVDQALDQLEALHRRGTTEPLVYDRLTLIHERADRLKTAIARGEAAIEKGLDPEGRIYARVNRVRRKVERLNAATQ
jgi:tetratricopeptide (TPR) repeat protein